MKHFHFRIILFLFILSGLNLQAKPDSTTVSREMWLAHTKPRQTWEKIVAFPGTVLNLPFKLIFKTTEKTIAFVDNSQIIPRAMDLLESDDERRAVLPTYASRTGGGIKFYQRDLVNSGSKLTFTLMAGMHHRQKYEIEFKNLEFRGLRGKFLTYYQMLSDESFFGLGPDAPESAESHYAHEQATASFTLGKHWQSALALEARAGVNLNNILQGFETEEEPNTVDIYSKTILPGLGEQLRFGFVEMSTRRDTRNRSGKPTAGGEQIISAALYQQIQGEDFGFWKLRGDFNQYIHLFYERTLKLRLAGEITRPIANRKIPFYYLSEFGEVTTIRGLERGRFRERDTVWGTLEYSYPLSQNQKEQSGIDAFLFVDSGQISNDLQNNFSFNAFKTGFGGGLRLYNDEGTTALIQLGFSEDAYRFYFILN